MRSLAGLACGASAVVTELPHTHGLAKRLISLGLTPGAEVRVLQNWGHGPLIVEVHGARVALGRGQAARVRVRPLAGWEAGAPECSEQGSESGAEGV